MGKRREKDSSRSSQTLPSSPSHSFSSSSSSDFEFSISLSPRKSPGALCRPADELFYKGQLLPLHLSSRNSMVRTLLLASSSTSSSSDTNSTTASRDSTGSSNDSASSFAGDFVLLGGGGDCDSSRPSSVTEDDEFRRLNNFNCSSNQIKKANKYFSLSRLFKKEPKINRDSGAVPDSSVKRMSATAREVIRKYLKKVKPLYEKLSQKQQQQKTENSNPLTSERSDLPVKNTRKDSNGSAFSHSFSGHLRYPRRKSSISSCPSSMRSSPTHSGVLSRNGFAGKVAVGGGIYYAENNSSMEELQSAIQGAIAHCKNSMMQPNKTIISNEI